MPSDVIGQVQGHKVFGRFQDWVLRQDKVWVDREGNVRLIERMDSTYILNVLQFLLWQHPQRLKRAAPARDAAAVPLVAALRAELIARLDKPAKELRYRRILLVQGRDACSPADVSGSSRQWADADLVISTQSGRVLKDRWGSPEPIVESVRADYPRPVRRNVSMDPIGIESVLRHAKDASDAWNWDRHEAGDNLRAAVIDYVDSAGHRSRRAVRVHKVGDDLVETFDLYLRKQRSFKFTQIERAEGPLTERQACERVGARVSPLSDIVADLFPPSAREAIRRGGR